MPSISGSEIEYPEAEQAGTETLEPDNLSSGSTASLGECSDDDEEIFITGIRVANLNPSLNRIPVGFYSVVHCSDLEWRTEVKSSPADNNVIEWDAHIPIPPDLSGTIRLEIHATFEFDTTLGNAEQLQVLETTVEKLLDNSENDLPFELSKDSDLNSPCPSILVTVGRGTHDTIEECCNKLKDAIEDVDRDLLRYRENKEDCGLEHSIKRFEHALNDCRLGHPCRVVVKSNMALAEAILYKVNNAGVALDAPLALYHCALSAIPFSHIDRPSALIHLAILHLARFEKSQEEIDGVQVEALLCNAMELCPSDSAEKWAAYSMLRLHARHKSCTKSIVQQDSASRFTSGYPMVSIAQLWERYERLGDLNDLQNAISLSEVVVESFAFRDATYAEVLHLFGSFLSLRFRRLGRLRDLERAISRQKDAVDFTPDDHPDKPAMMNNLGGSFFARFKRLGGLRDLEQAISNQRDAIELTPEGHPDRPDWLNNLGISIRTRFERLGELGDLEQAISYQMEAVQLIPEGDPGRPGKLSSLGNSLAVRFERLGDLSDLEQAISSQKDSVELTPDDHPEKSIRLNNLAVTFVTRFQRLEELNDLEHAISTQKKAIDLTPDDHPNKPSWLNNLGMSFITRFHRLGELNDLEQAISNSREAVELIPDGHSERPAMLNNLGNSFFVRFQRLGELSDVEQAISRQIDVIELIPDGHPDKPDKLQNLGISLFARFQHCGKLDDLERAISKFVESIELTPDNHPRKPGKLNVLGTSLLSRFERLGEFGDLEQAILSQKKAIELTPDGHPDKPGMLSGVGSSFIARFDRLGELNDLEQAITSQKAAIELPSKGYSDKAVMLNNLGNSFLIRFEHLGELNDLEQAILNQRDAIGLTPDGHPDKPSRLRGLGASIKARFERLGELGDIEEAISRHRDAVKLIPDGHPDRPFLLNSLGNSLLIRFGRLGEREDLEQAILSQKEAVELTADGHPGKPYLLNSLGISFRTRFEYLGELDDLERAISNQNNAIELIPDGNPEKPGVQKNLGVSLVIRFERIGELTDLEQAISRQKDAVERTPCDHPDKPGMLNDLGNSFLTRFEHLGELDDLQRAISIQNDAVRLTPDGHPDKPGTLSNLGNCFHARFERFREPGDLELAISLYSYSASYPTGPPTDRFDASLLWISCARASSHRSLLHAYSTAIGLLPQLAWIGLSLPHRFGSLMKSADVVRDAAAAALHSGYAEVAVEWLEQGRSIVWGNLFQLRGSYDELLAVYPDHARELRQLSMELEQAGAARENPLILNAAQGEKLGADNTLEQVANRHRNLAIERDNVLQEIRRLPGFERFLLHKEFYELRSSAHSGPIVILNAVESRCDALIVLADAENVIHVPLPDFHLAQSKALPILKDFVRNGEAIPSDEREGKRFRLGSGRWEPILRSLWDCIVKPVLDSLVLSQTLGKQLRMFWCPTGPLTFFPIHAAGLYDTDHSQLGHKIFDFVVSSYIPTLSVLAPSSDSRPWPESNDLYFLAVRQPLSDGQTHLSGVDAELTCIEEIIKKYPKTRLLKSCEGTVEEVLGLLEKAGWVHFACHGIQDAANPTESGLCLAHESRLKISNIISVSRLKGGLAFLSACQTATGDKELSDEAVHIAAGMLFAGFGGVVGTMWSIRDRLAPDVAGDVYEQLFSKGTRPDYREAAGALQNAVGRLRENGASFSEWIPFIHVGL